MKNKKFLLIFLALLLIVLTITGCTNDEDPADDPVAPDNGTSNDDEDD